MLPSKSSFALVILAMAALSQATSNSTLPSRGAAYAAGPSARDSIDFLFGNPWDPLTNPEGIVNLGAAENAAMLDGIVQLSGTHNHTITRDTFNLRDGAWGSKRLRVAMAKHVNKYLDIYSPFNETEIIFSTGVTALFELLGFSLFNPGDGILLTQPSYPGFASDFALKAGVTPIFVPFDTTDQFTPTIIANYEAALANHKNTTIRALVLCNPHNPLGRPYPRDTLVALMQFASRHKLHIIADEVYALSVYTDSPPFVSAFSFDSSAYIDPRYLHLLYSTSKDFAAFGLRLGALFTKNEELNRAVSALSTFHWAGNAVQQIAAQILEDEEGKKVFLADSRETARRNSGIARQLLDEAGIGYQAESNAGFFLWVDLGPFLGDGDGWEAEGKLTQRFLENGVFVLGGRSQSAERPGFFRLCFSQEEDALREGLRRMVETVKSGSA